MDFSYSEEQEAIRELAGQIFRDLTTLDGMRELEKSDGPRFDPELWKSLGEAGLVGIAIPEAFGGGGLGFMEVAVGLEQLARAVAPAPLYEASVLGALPLVEFGSDAQRKRWLPDMASGQAIWTAALVEAEAEDFEPTTVAEKKGGEYRVSGEKIGVPAAQLAQAMWVPARLDDGSVGIFAVETAAPGVTVVPIETTSGQPEAIVRFADVAVAADAQLGPEREGSEILAWIRLRATAGLCSMAAGVCDSALALTADYVKSRKQFDQSIAMFQAVGHRAADAYVDAEAVRLTAQQAAWRIAEGRPAESQVAIAKFFAAEAGSRVLLAAQHLHGGVGVDRDYALHRYYVYAKQLELALGGATAQLRSLGKMLAAETTTF